MVCKYQRWYDSIGVCPLAYLQLRWITPLQHPPVLCVHPLDRVDNLSLELRCVAMEPMLSLHVVRPPVRVAICGTALEDDLEVRGEGRVG